MSNAKQENGAEIAIEYEVVQKSCNNGRTNYVEWRVREHGNLFSLELCRLRGDLMDAYKIMWE